MTQIHTRGRRSLWSRGLHRFRGFQEGKKKPNKQKKNQVIQQHFISTLCSFIGPLAKAQKSVRLEITVAYNWGTCRFKDNKDFLFLLRPALICPSSAISDDDRNVNWFEKSKKKMLLLDKMVLCVSIGQGWCQGHMLAVFPGPTRGLCGAA